MNEEWFHHENHGDWSNEYISWMGIFWGCPQRWRLGKPRASEQATCLNHPRGIFTIWNQAHWGGFVGWPHCRYTGDRMGIDWNQNQTYDNYIQLLGWVHKLTDYTSLAELWEYHVERWLCHHRLASKMFWLQYPYKRDAQLTWKSEFQIFAVNLLSPGSYFTWTCSMVRDQNLTCLEADEHISFVCSLGYQDFDSYIPIYS